MKILETRNLRKIYGKGEAQVQALKDVSVSVEKGEFTAIVGASGSGKSTFLHLAGGLDTPTDGEVWVDGQRLNDMSRDELTIFRRRNIGFVFQQYNLVPMMNVRENILLPSLLDGKSPDRDYLEEIIRALGLAEKLDFMPNALSGGQQQRTAIARALASRPALLLADEPTGNLDSRSSQDVMGLLKAAAEQFHQTILMITHNEALAQTADRILRIEDGQILSDSRHTSRQEEGWVC